jgi:eukaryotic-like serine/threonine-protein kinase
MIESRHCPVCRTALPESAPEGFCPLCEFRGALAAPKDTSDRLAESEPVAGTQGREPPASERTPSETSEDPALGDPNRGRCLGDCELIEEIARGGMGVVYRARQRSLDRAVAVKLLRFGPHASPEHVKRFRVEANSAASLQHPNIVAIHEVGVHRGEHYLVMDLVDGPNLAVSSRTGPCPPDARPPI